MIRVMYKRLLLSEPGKFALVEDVFDAREVSVHEGALALYDLDGNPMIILPPGAWLLAEEHKDAPSIIAGGA